MIKFKKEFGYAEILSILTLIFSVYTYYLLQTKEDKEKYDVSIKSIQQRRFPKKLFSGIPPDTCFAYIHRYLLNNIGSKTLTLNSIEDSYLTNNNVLLSIPELNDKNDTALISYYPTLLNFDSISNVLTQKKIEPAQLEEINDRFLNIKIEPGESSTVCILFIGSYRTLNEQYQKYKNDSSFYLYKSKLNFKFSTGFVKEVDIFFTKYEMENHPSSMYDSNW